MSGRWTIVAALALLIVTGAGCSGSVSGRVTRSPARSAAQAGVSACPSAPAVQRRESAPWPSRMVLREGIAESSAEQLVDPAARAVFLLVSKTNAPIRGPWELCRISLATGAVRRGPTFPVGGLAMASGRLWLYGPAGPGAPPVVTEVNPVTMQRVRQIPLPSAPVAITAGSAGSVWIVSDRTLLRVSVPTGAAVVRVTLPAGLAGDDVSADPRRATVYVSAAHVVRGGMSGLVLLEYDARSGRKLAAADGGLISDSVMGAALTAVPGGVWASFRTGMLGLTVHRGARALRMIAPPGPGIALAPATGVFHWPMYETTAYGGGALWVANQVGIVACLDPRSGRIRASEHLPESRLVYSIDAIDPMRRVIYALRDGGLQQITPPRGCWN